MLIACSPAFNIYAVVATFPIHYIVCTHVTILAHNRVWLSQLILMAEGNLNGVIFIFSAAFSAGNVMQWRNMLCKQSI